MTSHYSSSYKYLIRAPNKWNYIEGSIIAIQDLDLAVLLDSQRSLLAISYYNRVRNSILQLCGIKRTFQFILKLCSNSTQRGQAGWSAVYCSGGRVFKPHNGFINACERYFTAIFPDVSHYLW